jgi:hypothetical protein
MAFKHLLHNSRAVRLGGIRVWRFHFGGGVYTVGAMSTLRFTQYIEAAGKAGPTLSEAVLTGAGAGTATLQLFRVLVPLMVSETVRSAHLEGASAAQILAVFEAWQEVNDLPYMLKSLRSAGDSKGQGFDRFVVNLARAMHLRVHELLHMPYQEVIATVEAINAEALDLPAGAEPLDDEERGKLRDLAARAGVEVN